MGEPHDPRKGYLTTLRMALLARGVKCELDTGGCVPRLRLDIPWLGGFDDAAFEDNIVAADEPDGQWRFWWPWAQPIAPVENLAQAVEHIYNSTTGPNDSDDGDGGGDGDGDDSPGGPWGETAERLLHLTGLPRRAAPPATT